MDSSHQDMPTSSEDTHPRPISLPPSAYSNSVSLLSQPAMDLPVELWGAIIDVLSFDAYSLLACCFTCRSFNDLARWKLSRLSFQILDGRPENGRLITEQIQKISTSARCIRNLIVRNSHMMASAVILAVPFKLSSQLTNLQCLTLINISDTSSIHPSVWPLFGHTVPSVSTLELRNINFPSFSTFIQFVRSFHSLKYLDLEDITSSRYQVRRAFLKGPIPWTIRIVSVLDQPPYEQFIEALSRCFHLNKTKFLQLIIHDYRSLCQINYQPIKTLGTHTESLFIDEFESSRGGEA